MQNSNFTASTARNQTSLHGLPWASDSNVNNGQKQTLYRESQIKYWHARHLSSNEIFYTLTLNRREYLCNTRNGCSRRRREGVVLPILVRGNVCRLAFWWGLLDFGGRSPLPLLVPSMSAWDKLFLVSKCPVKVAQSKHEPCMCHQC